LKHPRGLEGEYLCFGGKYYFAAVLCGCETWSLTLREEHRLRAFENRVLRRIFGPKTEAVMEAGRNCIVRSFITCTQNCQVMEEDMGRTCSRHGDGKRI
jgi:hypothetical protein